jgi:30S ribosomal protein S31
LTVRREFTIVRPAVQPTTEDTSMGKGDKRTRKGKTFKSSYGKTRPHKDKKKASPPARKSR